MQRGWQIREEMSEQNLSQEILLRSDCGRISVPLVTCVISNVLAGSCGCNWPQTSYPQQRCLPPREAWQPAAGSETPGMLFSSLLISSLGFASTPSPVQRQWTPRPSLWNHHALYFVRYKLCSSRCDAVQLIHSLSYYWRKARERVELAETVFSRTFNWKLMKVKKTPRRAMVLWQWWAACVVPPVLHLLCCRAFMPCWAGKWQEPRSPR